MKKKILFVFPKMTIGGATTSTLSILSVLSEMQDYDVDLLLLQHTGPLMDNIPENVHVLPPAYAGNKRYLKYRKLCSVRSILTQIKAHMCKICTKNPYVVAQMNEKDTVRYCRKTDTLYDVAIAGMELWPLYFVSENVKAKKKVAWIHVNYEKTKLKASVDKEAFGKMDEIVTVSPECEKSFLNVFPGLSGKVIAIENLISPQMIKQMAEESCDLPVNPEKVNFITVARLDNKSKAFDRTIPIFKKLVEEEHLSDWRWYIVGDGPDQETIKELIRKQGLQQHILLLGEQINPYKYVKKCDYFLLLSYYEGKPISVAEAQILGVVPVVTEYDSAESQTQNGRYGYVCGNNEMDIFVTLKKIIQGENRADSVRANLSEYTIQQKEALEKTRMLLGK